MAKNFKITSNAKRGGIWGGTRVVKELVTDDAVLAERLKAQGCTVEEVEQSLDEMNIAQLKKYAKANDIDLGDASTRDTILAAIKSASEE